MLHVAYFLYIQECKYHFDKIKMQISFKYIYIYIYVCVCVYIYIYFLYFFFFFFGFVHKKSDFNYVFKLELITTSHQKFIVKMLWTYQFCIKFMK